MIGSASFILVLLCFSQRTLVLPRPTHRILLLRLHLRISLPRAFNLNNRIPPKIPRSPRLHNLPLCPSLKQDRLRLCRGAVGECADGRCGTVGEPVEEGV